MARGAVEACKASGWEAERHVFLGTPEMIAEKIQANEFGKGRRLFYATVEHANAGKIYEYEHKQDNVYKVRVADTSAADAFNQAVEKAMYVNKGESCVGHAVQSLGEFKTLKFATMTEVTVSGDHGFAELLPLEQASQHAIPKGNPSARFTRVSFNVLC